MAVSRVVRTSVKFPHRHHHAQPSCLCSQLQQLRLTVCASFWLLTWTVSEQLDELSLPNQQLFWCPCWQVSVLLVFPAEMALDEQCLMGA